MSKKYYSLVQSEKEADIHIYGDITSWEWLESDVSSYTLSKEIEALEGVDTINVHINSYGGEVAEGLAIYNSLKRHNAKIKTYCDGFACSAASVIFMAGDERVMSTVSLLMIHNAWSYAKGNANQLRKQADDLEKITQASINAYMNEISISEEELKQLLDDESWITPQEALDMGFITTIINEKDSDKASQSVKKSLMKIILNSSKDDEENDDKKMEENKKFKCSSCGYIHEGEEPPEKCPECGSDGDQFKEISEEDEEPKEYNLGSFFNAIKNL